MALKKNQRIGPYVVVQVLPRGTGGFSQVVRARPASGRGQDVALKVARSDSTEDGPGTTTYADSLLNEVEMLRNLCHPGIVRLLPIPISDKRPVYLARDLNVPGRPWYFAMEFLEGGTVDDLVRKCGVLPPALAIEIAAQVARSLAYLHEAGGWHHDVKARNIMLRQPLIEGQNPQVVLGDFGVAQRESLKASVDGGSIEYLAPERIPELNSNGTYQSGVDPKKADIYALGVLLYYMVTGKLPFHGSRARITTAIRTVEPESPLVLNKALAQGDYRPLGALIVSMMAKDPDARPAAQRVISHLDRIAPPPRQWELRGHITHPRLALTRWLGLGAIVLVLGAAGMWAVQGTGRADEADILPTATATLADAAAVQIAGNPSEPTPSPVVATPTATAIATPLAQQAVSTATLAEMPTATTTPIPQLQIEGIAVDWPVNGERVTSLPFTLQWHSRSLAANERYAIELGDETGQATTLYSTADSYTLETWELAQNGEASSWHVRIEVQGEDGSWGTSEETGMAQFVVDLGSEGNGEAPSPTALADDHEDDPDGDGSGSNDESGASEDEGDDDNGGADDESSEDGGPRNITPIVKGPEPTMPVFTPATLVPVPTGESSYPSP